MVKSQVTTVVTVTIRRGGTTSFNDNLSSDNDSDTSDNDDLKMTVNIDKAMLNKQFQKLPEKMDQGKDDTVGLITYGIRSPVKNMTYGIAIWGLPKQIWCQSKVHRSALHNSI